jgi:excinuclease ABC subunit A
MRAPMEENWFFQGNLEEIHEADTHTTRFLNGTDQIHVPKIKRRWTDHVEVRGARNIT